MKKIPVLLCVLVVLYGLSWATNFGSSTDGKKASVTFTHTSACDSARAYFGFDGDGSGDDTANFYYTTKLGLCFDDTKKLLMSDDLDLDSTGLHIVKLVYFEEGASDTSGIVCGIWEHKVEVVSATCAGWGIRTVTVQFYDNSDSTTVISGVIFTAYDSATVTYQGAGVSNSSGQIVLSLDDNVYVFHSRKTPHRTDSPVYPTISSDTTLNYYVTTFDPGAPPSAEKCHVWCSVTKLTADYLAGCRLSIWIPSRYMPVTFDTTLVSLTRVTGVSNDTGYVKVPVYRSAELTAGDGTSTVKMKIELRAPGGMLIGKTFTEIPDQSEWEIVW